MKTTLFALLLCLSWPMLAQTDFNDLVREEQEEEARIEARSRSERIAITIGFLQGGGSLVGGDLELMATDRLGLQIGAGFVGYGFSLNYHLKPTPRSSAISLAYWHQGIGDSFAQSVVGPTFVFRAKRLFTAQLGLGYRLDYGPAMDPDFLDTPVLLMYSIGLYIAR